MSFKANQTNLNVILSRNYTHSVPKNQRKYIWEEDQWNDLFEDIFLIDQSNSYCHFIGSVVFARSKKKNTLDVIDGQQRLITITVIMAAITNQLLIIGEVKAATSNVLTFLKGTINGDDYYKVEREDGLFFLMNIIDELSNNKVINSDSAAKLFSDYYKKTDKYNEKILKCYQYYDKRISDYIKSSADKRKSLIELKDKLVQCEVIEIIVEEGVDGFRVFETLNARGIPLEQHELLKNYLHSYLRTKSNMQLLESSWNSIIENVTFDGIDHFSMFISHYCTHCYGKTKKNKEFDEVRKRTDKKDVKNLLISLTKNSKYYSYFIDPVKMRKEEYYSEGVNISLEYFKKLNIRQVRPLLLSLFEKVEEKSIVNEEFAECLRIMETFYFIYSTVLKNTTNIIDNTINNLAKKIHDCKKEKWSEELIKELSKFVSEKEKIIECFSTIGFSNKNKKFKNTSNKRAVNYVFTKFERYYDVNDENVAKISSIEHIMNDDKDIDYCSYIGNLLPISSRLNHKIDSKPFADKIIWYKRSKLNSVKIFVDEYSGHESWCEEDIKKRGKKLAVEGLNNIWLLSK